jgi:hypothetical protein
MKTPSIKTLSAVFDDPKEAKRILQMSHAELSCQPVAAARIAECFNRPAWHDVRLTVLNSIDPGLHGVETIQGDEYADYLNTGDTYAPTLIYWRGAYRVQSVGDFVETMERQGVHFD